jgi:RecA/RadA recombinase
MGDLAGRRGVVSSESLAIPGVRTASNLEVRPAPEMVPFGISALDALTGGVPRGALTEMVGPASSGRTSVMMALMAEVTRRQEVCALVDVTDSFDPASAEAAGVDLRRVLWVRCGNGSRQPSTASMLPGTPTMNVPQSALTNDTELQQAITSGCFEASRGRREPVLQTMNKVAPPAKNISWSIHENYDSRLRHAMVNGGENYKARTPSPAPARKVERPLPQRVTPRNFVAAQKAKWDRLDQALKALDLLIQSGGFGLVIVDLGDIPVEQARRIPLTSWFRFRRAVENTPTILMALAKDSCAKTCASLVMQLSADPKRSGHSLTHVSLLDGLNVHVDVLRTRLERKPVRSAGASLETRTLWKKTG